MTLKEYNRFVEICENNFEELKTLLIEKTGFFNSWKKDEHFVKFFSSYSHGNNLTFAEALFGYLRDWCWLDFQNWLNDNKDKW